MDFYALFDADSDVWMLVKILVLIGLSVYLVFALVIVKQVNHMTETLEVGFEKQLKAMTIIHLFFALGTIVVALLIL